MNTTCPPPDKLRQYLLGRYTDSEGEAIEQHLAECAACDETLAAFDDTNDSLLRHLPLAAGELITQESAPPAWLARLKGKPPEETLQKEHDAAADDSPVIEGLDSYELTGVIGKGGMGVVYRARHRQLNRPVAIKVVNPKLVSAAEARRRFNLEIRILGGLNHSGIVMATDAGKVGGAAYLVMELIDGIDLRKLVHSAGPLGIGEACEAARQMAVALSAAHEAGAIHRDVKPSNVMIDRNGHVKLLDFGLAHLTELTSEHHETSLGRLLGTLDYMAPEQANGDAVEVAADLYGLGATLFFLLTGRSPHGAGGEQTLLQQLKRLANEEAPPLAELRADAPSELNRLVASLLARDPNERPQTAREVAEELTVCADNSSLERLRASIPSIEEPADEKEVTQSLMELLGPNSVLPLRDGDDRRTSASPSAVKAGGRRNRRFGGWLVALSGIFAAALSGIVLLIETAEGTLRIESDVDGVQVDVLDEGERVTTLQIEQGEKTTELKAGTYRIRLAGGHDSLSLSPETIVLRKGEQQVAKITRLPGTDNTAESVVPSVPRTSERTYQGQPLSVWQQRFDSETNPVVRLEAAKALVSLANGLNEGEKVDRLIEIGGELFQAGWGDEAPAYALKSVVDRQTTFAPARWSLQTYSELNDDWRSLLQLIETELSLLAPRVLADRLSEKAASAPPTQAAFAMLLLSQNTIRNHIGKEQEPTDAVLRQLQRDDITELKQACLLLRADYYGNASTEQQRKLQEDLENAGKMLADKDSNDGDILFAKHWAERANELEIEPVLIARVALRAIIGGGDAGSYLVRASVDNKRLLLSRYIADARQSSVVQWDEWIPLTNEWLKNHAETEPAESVAAIIQTVGYVLRGGKPTDLWDGDDTARILTEYLRAYYVRRESEEDESRAAPLPGINPHDLLASIILCGSEIPDIARQQPQSDEVREQLAELQRFANAGISHKEYVRDKKNIAGLMQNAPYQTVKIVIEANDPPEKSPPGRSIVFDLIPDAATQDTRERPLEPLLFLAIATELAGVNAEQDVRIANLLSTVYPSFTNHIDDALGSEFEVRQIAEKWLERIAERATSDELLEQIRKLMPSLNDTSENARSESTRDDAPQSLAAAAASFNEETAEERTELLFNVPELTVAHLREGIAQAAERYRKQGKESIANSLQQIADSGQLPEKVRVFGGFASGKVEEQQIAESAHLPENVRLFAGFGDGKDEDGDVRDPNVVPVLILPSPGGASDSVLVTLGPLELMYQKDGPSSKAYGGEYEKKTGSALE